VRGVCAHPVPCRARVFRHAFEVGDQGQEGWVVRTRYPIVWWGLDSECGGVHDLVCAGRVVVLLIVFDGCVPAGTSTSRSVVVLVE
jgi:hypothetical protein